MMMEISSKTELYLKCSSSVYGVNEVPVVDNFVVYGGGRSLSYGGAWLSYRGDSLLTYGGTSWSYSGDESCS